MNSKMYRKKSGPGGKIISLMALLLVMGIFLLPYRAFAQSFVVKGTVKSVDGTETMPGVNVLIKGTTQGTATDIDGNFSIEVPS